MPTYEYACKSCGERLEVVQSFSDDPLTECPSCGGTLSKVFSPVGIVFKGGGFYKNDSRPAGSGDAAKKSDSAPSTAATATPSSGDTSSSSSSSSSTSSS